MSTNLFIDWGGSPTLVETAENISWFTSNGKPQTCPFKSRWRIPWENIDHNKVLDMNYSITINPDPNLSWLDDTRDRKLLNRKFRETLRICKNKKLYKNIIVIYEYGKQGKRYGKLHYHLLVNSKKINLFCDEFIKTFGTTKKRWKLTVVKKLIKPDYGIPDELKITNLNDQKKYIYETYFRKEQHNKLKCLYSSI